MDKDQSVKIINTLDYESFSFNELLNFDDPELFFEKTKPFIELMMKYQCALREVQTKFEVLNEEFSVRYNRNPVETIKTRIKKPLSIVEKLRRHGYEISVEDIREHVHDVAGLRVICSFPEDIYNLVEMFTRQDDIRVLAVKDYIKHPKSSGYRSLHLIVEIPIFLSNVTEHMAVEVQFRTIAMDFWASLEHKLKYKKDVQNPEEIAEELKLCSDAIASIDMKMQEIRNKIDSSDSF